MINGTIAFTISDNDLDIAEIETELCFKPTKCVKRGQQISKFKIAPFDVWLYQIDFEGEMSFENELDNLMAELSKSLSAINNIRKRYREVTLDFYIRSEMGQMGLTLNSSTLQKLACVGLDANFHILSYGLVE